MQIISRVLEWVSGNPGAGALRWMGVGTCSSREKRQNVLEAGREGLYWVSLEDRDIKSTCVYFRRTRELKETLWGRGHWGSSDEKSHADGR